MWKQIHRAAKARWKELEFKLSSKVSFVRRAMIAAATSFKKSFNSLIRLRLLNTPWRTRTRHPVLNLV